MIPAVKELKVPVGCAHLIRKNYVNLLRKIQQQAQGYLVEKWGILIQQFILTLKGWANFLWFLTIYQYLK